MHAQTESAPEHRAHFASSLHVASGLGLYLLTLAGEAMLGAGVRWLLTYLGASALGLLFPLGPGAEGLAWIAALAPLLFSLAGLLLPGQARLWSRRLGARTPSAEEAAALTDAMALLRSADPSLPGPSRCPEVPGNYRLRVWLEDAVGHAGPATAAPIPRDTTPPAAPQGIAVASPQASKAQDGFDLRWRNIVDAGSPIDAAHYQVLNGAGQVVVATRHLSGANVEAIESIETPNERGAFALRLWLTDAEGNGWLAFRRYRTRGDGRYELAYYFRRTTRPTVYEVRAQVRETVGYPYVQGDSDPILLRVLPDRKRGNAKPAAARKRRCLKRARANPKRVAAKRAKARCLKRQGKPKRGKRGARAGRPR